MAEALDPLILDLVEWVAAGPRAYAELMDAWRTNCPRLTVWEDALADDLIRLEGDAGWGQAAVALTPRGRAALEGIAPPRGD